MQWWEMNLRWWEGESFERGGFACWGISRVLASGGRGDFPIRENRAIDVPNVNQEVLKIFDELSQDKAYLYIIDIESWHLHGIHGDCKIGMKTPSQEIDSYIIIHPHKEIFMQK